MKGFEKAIIKSLSKHDNKTTYDVNLDHKGWVLSIKVKDTDEATYSI